MLSQKYFRLGNVKGQLYNVLVVLVKCKEIMVDNKPFCLPVIA